MRVRGEELHAIGRQALTGGNSGDILHRRSGITFKMIFTADGKALRVPTGNGGSRSEGSWKLDENGYCSTWKGGKPNYFTLLAADKNKWSLMRGQAVIATRSK
jgi:hypothetical protein